MSEHEIVERIIRRDEWLLAILAFDILAMIVISVIIIRRSR